MVTTFYPPYHFGGDGIFVHRLTQELARRGHHVEVIHCVDAFNLLAGEKTEQVFKQHPNITVHSLRSRAGALSPILTQQSGRPVFKGAKIERILGRGKFDVIHYHNISLIGGPHILSYGEAIKLYTLHEYWLICPTHVLFKNNQEACSKPNCTRCTLSYRRPPQYWRYTKLIERTVTNIDAFIAPSRFTAKIHQERGLDIPTVQIPMFIPDTFAISEDHPTERVLTGRTERRPYFLYVGRLEKLKGVHTIIPEFRHFPDADLLVAGSGSFENELQHLASEIPNVRFLGQLRHSELVDRYRHAAALIVPSLCYETFGQIVMEAFSLHTPVIARDIGAIGELVGESGGGLLFKSETELPDLLRLIVSEPDTRNELARKAYLAYRARGTVNQFMNKYLCLINRIRKAKSPVQ